MKRMSLTKDISEPDLDMTRVIVRLGSGRVRRLLGLILRKTQGYERIDPPRRSVDREQQLYSADYD